MEDELGPARRRSNGFELPWHPLQVVAWFVFGADVLVYACFGLPLISGLGAKVCIGILYALSVVVVVIATYRATACDPIDPNVTLRIEHGEDIDSMPYCSMCCALVASRSKHCRSCGKCVDIFDHHCMWLNNCIGAANYRDFFAAISSVVLMIGIILGTVAYLLVAYLADEEGFWSRLFDGPLETLPREFFLVVFFTLAAVNGPLFALDGQLVLLHLFLYTQGLTTFEYIMGKRFQQEAEPGGHSGASDSRFVRRIRTLPRCCDWIFFCRCGSRRGTRQKQTKQTTRVERIGEGSKRGCLDAPNEGGGLDAAGRRRPVLEVPEETMGARQSRETFASSPSHPSSMVDLQLQSETSSDPLPQTLGAPTPLRAAAGSAAGAVLPQEAPETEEEVVQPEIQPGSFSSRYQPTQAASAL